MADFFVDYENGNDANDGTTFANRVQRLTALSGSLSAGDNVRIMRSPPPTSLGQAAQWTNGSNLITLTSAVNLIIENCETVWTGTNANTFISTFNKQGTRSHQANILAGAGAGPFPEKISHFALPSTVDASGYERVSFWFRTNIDRAAGVFELRLCSDTTGDTPVHTIPIPALEANIFLPVLWDNGGALSSNINSVSVAILSDPGTPIVYVDNIVACLPASDPDSITHQSLLGKNTAGETWWPIAAIEGTAIYLDRNNDEDHGVEFTNYYPGTTESVTTWKREGVVFPESFGGGGIQPGTGLDILDDAGSDGFPITISGGWNTTDMTTREDETWINGVYGVGRCFACNGAWAVFEYLAPYRFGAGFRVNSTGTNFVVRNCKAVAMQETTINAFDIDAADPTIEDCIATANNGSGFRVTDVNVSFLRCEAYANLSHGFLITSDSGTRRGATLTECVALRNGVDGFAIFGRDQIVFTDCVARFNDSGFNATGNVTSTLIDCISTDNLFYGFETSGSAGVPYHELINFTASDNAVEAVRLVREARMVVYGMTSTNHPAVFRIDNRGHALVYGLISTSDSAIYTEGLSFAERVHLAALKLHHYQGDPGDNRIYGLSYAVRTDDGTAAEDNRRTASGLAWGIATDGADRDTDFRSRLPIAQVQLQNGVTTTVNVWLKRTSANIDARIICRGRQIAGIDADVIDTLTANGTYEQLSLALTPTADGVVEIWVEVWNGTLAEPQDALTVSNDRVFVDDISFS